jgi:hypothetical protein
LGIYLKPYGNVTIEQDRSLRTEAQNFPIVEDWGDMEEQEEVTKKGGREA